MDAGRYGQQAGGTHTTGMHTCKKIFTSCNEVVAKVMFLQVSVIHSVHRGVSPWQGESPLPLPPSRENPPSPQQGEPPRPGRTPPGQGEPPRQGEPPWQGEPPPPPGRENPPGPGRTPRARENPLRRGRTPQQGESPCRENPPWAGRTPPQEADSSIRSTSGLYASYWNAFLLRFMLWTNSTEITTITQTYV